MEKLKKTIRTLKDTFIPSRKNEGHPYVFRREAIVAVVMAILIVEAGFLVQEFVVFRKDNFLAAVLPGYVMSLTNTARNQDHLKSLSENTLLREAAQKKAEDMALRGYFSHTGPDGKLPWQWLDSVGYSYRYAGENLAVNFTDTKELVDGWLASPGHRANILRSSFTDIGIGMATGTYKGRETIFVVQFFGAPATKPLVKAVDQPKDKKSTTSVAITEIAPNTPVVFGTSTYNSMEDISPIAKPFLSPNTILKGLFVIIVAVLLGLAILGMFIHFRLPHPRVLAGCIFVLAIILGILYLNNNLFVPSVEFPTDISASVVNAVR